MENIKLNFLHLCDAASIDMLGKINILGIFTKIFLTKVPSKLLKFTVVGNVSFQKLSKSKLKIEVKIIDSNKKEVEIKPPIEMEFMIPETTKENKSDLNIILDLGNLEFAAFGEHKVIVYANGIKIGDKDFLVEPRKEKKKI